MISSSTKSGFMLPMASSAACPSATPLTSYPLEVSRMLSNLSKLSSSSTIRIFRFDTSSSFQRSSHRHIKHTGQVQQNDHTPLIPPHPLDQAPVDTGKHRGRRFNLVIGQFDYL